MRTDGDYLWKLALRRKVAGYVRIECCRSLKMFGDGHMGIEYKHLLPKLMAKGLNRPRLIVIACYQNKAVGSRAHGIDECTWMKPFITW